MTKHIIMAGRYDRLWPLAPFGAAAIALSLMSVGATVTGLRWNWTASAPIGLWHETGSHMFRTGDYVLACPPATAPIIAVARERGYIHGGDCPGGLAPVLKLVFAEPGATVILTPSSVGIDGDPPIHAVTLDADSDGLPLPHMVVGTYKLDSNQYWLLSPANPRSIDSRYFGPIDRASIKGVATPYFTFDLYTGAPT